jgi:uncharacterized protein (TIGR02466 family)
MPEIYKLFPTPVYYEENIINEKDNDFIIDCCYKIKNVAKRGGEGWHTKLYNTAGTHNIVYDKNFKQLNLTIQQHLQQFVKVNGSSRYYNLDTGWINIYQNNDYQEYHYHTSSVFSIVYYPKVPENSGGLILNSPKEPDMFPIKDVDEENEFNHAYFKFYPKERSIIIFRSFVEHMVQPGQNESERISIAYNAS